MANKLNILAGVLFAALCLGGCTIEDKEPEKPAQLTTHERTLSALDAGKASAIELFDGASAIGAYLDGTFANDENRMKMYALLTEAKSASDKAAEAVVADPKDAQKQSDAKTKKEAFDAATEAYKPFAKREQQLLAKRAEYISSINTAAKDDAAKNEIRTAFSAGPSSRFSGRMNRLMDCFNALANSEMQDIGARERVRQANLWISDYANAQEARDTVAREMIRLMNAFYADWSPVECFNRNGGSLVEDAISPFALFKRPEDLGQIVPYQPLDAAQLAEVSANLEKFAARYPDGELARALRADDKAKKIERMGDEAAGGLAVRSMVELVVHDLYKAHPNETMEPIRTFRKVMVARYSQATGITTPNSLALVMAILGSLVLYGGLTVAVWRAVRSKGAVPSAPPPST